MTSIVCVSCCKSAEKLVNDSEVLHGNFVFRGRPFLLKVSWVSGVSDSSGRGSVDRIERYNDVAGHEVRLGGTSSPGSYRIS